MHSVKFGSYHSYADFSLILTAKEINAPSPKIGTVDIPGGDGELDLTEYFGETKYYNRKIKLDFSTTVPMNDFLPLFSRIQNAIHGQKLHIVLDDDPEFYYVGRVTLDKWKSDGRIGKISIECDCEPYKYKRYKTTVTNAVTSDAVLTYTNSRKRVVPTITTDASIMLTFGTSTYTLSAGTYTDPEIVFEPGINTFTVTGTATVTVSYQEGGL